MELVVYGSFNCPYSFLASLRADRLVAAGYASLDWRAVVHDPDVPAGGVAVGGELAEMFDRELGEIRALLAPGERYPARRPSVQSNTTQAVAGYAVAPNDHKRRLRSELFSAFWVDGDDIGERALLDSLGCPAAPPGETMRRWNAEWRGMARPVVPMMVLPGGQVSRGLGALSRLAEMDRTASARKRHGT
jgi:hypothetical protein